MFFSFDGVDGGGKTTQIKLFCQWLQSSGRSFVTCRDPGSTRLGDKIRDIVLNADDSLPIGARCETLLYMAARSQMVEEVIKPALRDKAIVVSDRYLLANIVYQAYAGELPVSQVKQVGEFATFGIMPDCIFLLDVDPETATARMGRDLDRMERRGDAYRQKLRSGFQTEAKLAPRKIHVIDATPAPESVAATIRQIAQSYFTENDRD